MALMFILLLLHAYVGWRLIPALAFAPPLQWLLGALLLASWLLMPMALLARRIRRQPLSDRLAWTGLLLMGLFSSLFVLTLLRDAAARCRCGLASFWGPLPGWLAPASAAAVPALAALLTLWGLVNARRTAQVVRVDVPIAQLPAALHGFSIAQISDVHVGPTIKRGYLQAIVERINALQADMVAVTGDLVDGSVQELAHHVAPLAGLSSRHGTFFVTGNHEYYSGAHAWVDELRRLGLQRADERACAARGMAMPRWRWPAWPTTAPTTSTNRTAATRRPPWPVCPPTRWCACCWRTSRAARRRRPRPASTCSCPATPTAGSSCRGTGSCGCSSPSPPG